MGMGISMEDIKKGFSIDIDLSSNEFSVRADKVIQLVLNTKEANSCGGKVSYQSVLSTGGSLRACGPNEALLLIALMCLMFMKNRYLLKIFELSRFVLAYDRASLLRRLPEIIRLFLMREDMSTPEAELTRNLCAWLRLICALL